MAHVRRRIPAARGRRRRRLSIDVVGWILDRNKRHAELWRGKRPGILRVVVLGGAAVEALEATPAHHPTRAGGVDERVGGRVGIGRREGSGQTLRARGI